MSFVRIKHKDVEGTGLVSERAFLRVHQTNGWELANTQPLQPADDPGEPQRPHRNESTDTWRDYAVARGMTREDADEQGRDELVAYFDALDSTPES